MAKKLSIRHERPSEKFAGMLLMLPLPLLMLLLPCFPWAIQGQNCHLARDLCVFLTTQLQVPSRLPLSVGQQSIVGRQTDHLC